ncbi:MAG: nicotinamide-nucleotide adenylyltransferase [Candidatus Marsarchaeota archaeon]|nr:nicotinamide-nucleotide adenylyltransferase [Candidatus Marsarchaeota archaeon]
MKTEDRALLVGRFQPIHKGHIHAVNEILSKHNEIVIVVGSAQASHTLENPLTAGERVYMINKALHESGIDLSRSYIITVPDIQFNSVWPFHLRSYAPPFNTVYTGNSLVATLFREVHVEVRHPSLYKRPEISGTKIRELLIKGDDSWRQLVPAVVAKIIEEMRIRSRLLSIIEDYDRKMAHDPLRHSKPVPRESGDLA